MPTPCEACADARAVIVRPKNQRKLCRTCFLRVFEDEVHDTIVRHRLFTPSERVAVGASGGKDSTVLAAVLQTLNARHGYGVELVLLSVDEGIRGYRDDSLATVKRNAAQYGLPLLIVGYDELYGWTMDQVVAQIGKRRNCTYCGVFRRQALDRGAARLGLGHVVTGHNADDAAETVLMNLLRGDLPRLARAAKVVTASPASRVRRSKPLMYAYEKEIVLYAHHRRLDYFTTECIYSPEAFRGTARTLVKDLERIRPSAILDVVRSGEDMARLVPGQEAAVGGAGPAGAGPLPVDVDEEGGAGGCGSGGGRGGASSMVEFERQLQADEAAEGRETEVALPPPKPVATRNGNGPRRLPKPQLQHCQRCGYMSSQTVCKACVLLEGLNRNRPKVSIQVEGENEKKGKTLTGGMDELAADEC